ncbi:MAG TPA: SRPBCC family protein [Usitatibacter sp.]|jgi:uncharacterized protein YndB with AHSA1/START domain|nr:SRPBCC family protein [Usitatibacter sp.]
MPEENAKPGIESTALPFSKWVPLLAGALLGVAIRIVFSGKPGNAFAAMSSGFIYITPGIVGAVTVYLAERTRRRSWGYYLTASVGANLLFVLGTMAILIEGIICAVIIAPLFAILGALGGLIMGAICRWTNWPGKALYSIGVLPLVIGFLDPAVPTTDEIGVIERTTVIDAPAATVWRHILSAPSIDPRQIEKAWLFRIGVPLPRSGVFEEQERHRVRRVTMGKDIHFDEVITDWETDRFLRWTYRYYADSFPPHALDEHVVLGGHYFDIRDTAYRLAPVGDRTRLTVTMHYRITTRFNWYAVPVGDWLLGNLAEANIGYYRQKSESKRL